MPPDEDLADETFAPCADALVAGTVALMTSYVDPCVHSSVPVGEQRVLLARKIVSNLFFLRQHPALCPELRQVMAMAHERWVALAQTAAALAAEGARLASPAGRLH